MQQAGIEYTWTRTNRRQFLLGAVLGATLIAATYAAPVRDAWQSINPFEYAARRRPAAVDVPHEKPTAAELYLASYFMW